LSLVAGGDQQAGHEAAAVGGVRRDAPDRAGVVDLAAHLLCHQRADSGRRRYAVRVEGERHHPLPLAYSLLPRVPVPLRRRGVEGVAGEGEEDVGQLVHGQAADGGLGHGCLLPILLHLVSSGALLRRGRWSGQPIHGTVEPVEGPAGLASLQAASSGAIQHLSGCRLRARQV
jgi:hypothetical protein